MVFGVYGLGFRVKRCKASSRRGISEGLGLVRLGGLCSALGLEPAFRRGSGLGAGFTVQLKVNKIRTLYVAGFVACVRCWPCL